jgi:hypothetical protein
MATMLLGAHGPSGHVVPFLRLSQRLSERGHEVTLLTHAPYAAAARAAGVDFVPIDTGAEHARYMDDLRRTDAGGPGAHDVLGHHERHDLFGLIGYEVETFAERHRPGDTVVICRHTTGLSALVAAELLDVPAVWLATSHDQRPQLPFQVRLHRTVLAPGIDRVRNDLGLVPVRDWHAWLRSAGLEIGPWPESPAGWDVCLREACWRIEALLRAGAWAAQG